MLQYTRKQSHLHASIKLSTCVNLIKKIIWVIVITEICKKKETKEMHEITAEMRI